MSDRQIELLRKALELYDFTIEQHRLFPSDNTEDNEFFEMREALSKLIGEDVT